MIAADEKWNQMREVLEGKGLSVIVRSGSAEPVRAVFDGHGLDVEIVEVDESRYSGLGAALQAAFDRTTGAYVMLLGGDLVANAGQVPEFFAEMLKKGADIVVGSKRHERSSVGYPWYRRILSWGYHTFVRWTLGVKVSDTRTGVRLFRRETLAYALERMLVKAYAFDLEILAISAHRGAKIAEAPVVVSSGTEGGISGIPDRGTIRAIVKDTLAIVYRLRILGYYDKCLVPNRLDHDPLVSVVIACPHDSWMLQECLAGLRRQTYRNWEAIVLPDGTTDGDSGVPAPRPADGGDIRFIPTGKVRPAEKRNLGIREAKGEIVAFIDDDAYPEEHWLEYAVKYFGDRDIGAVGGPGVTPPGDRRLARIGGFVYDNFLVSGNYRYRYKAGGVRMDVEDYPSCNLFVRKDLLDKVGGYRTDFWPGEDTLLCKDIIDSWKRIIYDPWVVVYHHRRALFMPHLRQLGRYGFHRGYFCKRFPSNSLRASYFVPTAFVAYLALLAIAVAVIGGIVATGVAVSVPAGLLVAAVSPLALYLALDLLSSFHWKPHYWILTALGVFASHVCYGIRFMQGLCARKAPCEYIGKDHA